ncbi:hypothetical protein GCM10023107_35670 [Actinoplanes octamycinicus]|nr:hypothetical protein Aoc01nite_28880 [Actinoplanes octamycinicus]
MGGHLKKSGWFGHGRLLGESHLFEESDLIGGAQAEQAWRVAERAAKAQDVVNVSSDGLVSHQISQAHEDGTRKPFTARREERLWARGT